MILIRRSNVLKAADRVDATRGRVQAVLDLPDDELKKLPEDDRSRAATLRNEVHLIGDELNEFEKTFANCKAGRRNVPTAVEFMAVRDAFGDLTISHRIEPLSDADVESTLTSWAT
jgi:hypothetical protein